MYSRYQIRILMLKRSVRGPSIHPIDIDRVKTDDLEEAPFTSISLKNTTGVEFGNGNTVQGSRFGPNNRNVFGLNFGEIQNLSKLLQYLFCP